MIPRCGALPARTHPALCTLSSFKSENIAVVVFDADLLIRTMRFQVARVRFRPRSPVSVFSLPFLQWLLLHLKSSLCL